MPKVTTPDWTSFTVEDFKVRTYHLLNTVKFVVDNDFCWSFTIFACVGDPNERVRILKAQGIKNQTGVCLTVQIEVPLRKIDNFNFAEDYSVARVVITLGDQKKVLKVKAADKFGTKEISHHLNELLSKENDQRRQELAKKDKKLLYDSLINKNKKLIEEVKENFPDLVLFGSPTGVSCAFNMTDIQFEQVMAGLAKVKDKE